ncbi:serine hydrolase [Pedobacter sp. KBS0701]|nr:serine hydrolase [Pedobacter sp. KBS0701]
MLILQKERHIRHKQFKIWSVSKTFIAVSLMKAMELGYFDLDTDIKMV